MLHVNPARYELYNTNLMTLLRLTNTLLHSLPIIAVPILLPQHAAAFPFMAPRTFDSSLDRRNQNNTGTSSSVSAQIWVGVLTLPCPYLQLTPCSQVPILVITFVIAIAAIWTCTKKRWWAHMLNMSMFSWGSTATNAAPTQETREVTAEQLAGSINANAATTNTGRARRNRRPRRTPSQISTTSLPAYMKEPGEQELVIFR
jgi:hypothetical protein